MARVTLKSLLGKKKEAAAVMANVAAVMDSDIAVEDVSGTLLLGNGNDHHSGRFPVELEGEVLGWVTGSDHAKPVAELISHLASKEAEKKTLGQEVLGLYREINLIYNFSEDLAAALDLATVAKMAVEQAGQMISSTGGAIFLLKDQTDVLEVVSTFGEEFKPANAFKLGEGLIGEIAASANAEIINEVAADPRKLQTDRAISSVICAPLKVKKRVLGVIVLANATPVVYTAADLKLLTTLAVQTASAVESALLHEKAVHDAREREREKAKMALLEAENQRKSEELEEARQLQLSMLPKNIPQLPNLEIAVHMQTATEVGGDYYDFKTDDDGTLTVAIGDAAGHGTKAGIMVAAVKSLFEVLASQGDILHIFEKITVALRAMNLGGKMFMAMTVVKIKDYKMKLAAAGMPLPLVWRAAAENVETIELKGMPLGSFEKFPYRQAEIDLQPGDTVVLMSDGLPELFNPEGETLDYPTLAKLVAESDDKTPYGLIEFLTKSGEEWANGRAPADDITFVVLKLKSRT